MLNDIIFHALPMILIIWALALAFSKPRRSKSITIHYDRDRD